MQRPSILIILLQPRATPQNLWQPKLSHSTLHMSNLSLRGRRRLNPLCRLAPNTTHHVGMCEGLGSTLLGLDVQGRWNGLGDARVQRRGAAGNHEGLVVLVAGARAAVAVAGARAHEGGVCAEGWSHCDGFEWVVKVVMRVRSTLGGSLVRELGRNGCRWTEGASSWELFGRRRTGSTALEGRRKTTSLFFFKVVEGAGE